MPQHHLESGPGGRRSTGYEADLESPPEVSGHHWLAGFESVTLCTGEGSPLAGLAWFHPGDVHWTTVTPYPSSHSPAMVRMSQKCHTHTHTPKNKTKQKPYSVCVDAQCLPGRVCKPLRTGQWYIPSWVWDLRAVIYSNLVPEYFVLRRGCRPHGDAGRIDDAARLVKLSRSHSAIRYTYLAFHIARHCCRK